MKTETINFFFFKDSLNGNELINHIKEEIEKVGIVFYVYHRTYFISYYC